MSPDAPKPRIDRLVAKKVAGEPNPLMQAVGFIASWQESHTHNGFVWLPNGRPVEADLFVGVPRSIALYVAVLQWVNIEEAYIVRQSNSTAELEEVASDRRIHNPKVNFLEEMNEIGLGESQKRQGELAIELLMAGRNGKEVKQAKDDYRNFMQLYRDYYPQIEELPEVPQSNFLYYTEQSMKIGLRR